MGLKLVVFSVKTFEHFSFIFFFSRHLRQLLIARWMYMESAYNWMCFQFSLLSQHYKNCLLWQPQFSAFQSLYHFLPLSKFTNNCASDSSHIRLSPSILLWKKLNRTSYWIKLGYLTTDLEHGIITCKITQTFIREVHCNVSREE